MGEVNIPTRLVLPFGKTDAEAMKELVNLSPLPTKPPIPTTNPWELGIDHALLVQLSKKLQTTWSYEALERKMTIQDNYLVKMKDGEDELTVHFVHRRSSRSHAIPLLLR